VLFFTISHFCPCLLSICALKHGNNTNYTTINK
jgi:hypothetical protein